MQAKKPDIGALLNPRTVAIIGAAPAGQGIRGRILEVLRGIIAAGLGMRGR